MSTARRVKGRCRHILEPPGHSENLEFEVKPGTGGVAVEAGLAEAWGVRLYAKLFPLEMQARTTILAEVSRRLLREAAGGREPANLAEATSLLLERGVAPPLGFCRIPPDSVALLYPYVEGKPLTHLYNPDNPVEDSEARRAFCKVARVAVFIESAGVLHGDFHYGNILVRDGEPVVSDFDGSTYFDPGPGSKRLASKPLYRPSFEDLLIPLRPRVSPDTRLGLDYLDYYGVIATGVWLVGSSKTGSGSVGRKDSKCCIELDEESKKAFRLVLGDTFLKHLEHVVEKGVNPVLVNPVKPITQLYSELREEGVCT